MSKTILPWFGGTPAVWTTCVLFFQVVLFLGYLYAHLLTRYLPPARQGGLHVMLLAAALFFVPISPAETWKPAGDQSPTVSILLMLMANVGLPYFLLSTTGPLLQAWFSRSCSGHSPYRLYALSNIGSLVALLSYPFVFEPLLSIMYQDWLWSAGFCLFALTCAVLALHVWRTPAFQRPFPTRVPAYASEMPRSEVNEAPAPSSTSPKSWRSAGWLILPAIASVALLAITNHVCQDVAVVPFLWILPLSIYLLTFIICFDKESWYSRRWMSAGAIASVLVLNLLVVDDYLADQLLAWGISFRLQDVTENLFATTGAHLATLFFICMLCHGELVRSKPSSDGLTTFYLMCGAGGAIGGILVGVVCPLIFETYVEVHLTLMAGIIFATCLFWLDAARSYLANNPFARSVLRVAGIAFCFLVVKVQLASNVHGNLVTVRNFYGVLRVDHATDEQGKPIARQLIHGSTIHGSQFTSPEKSRQPTTYYSETSGAGRAVRQLQASGPVRIGVVGLGTGTLAAYGRAGDYIRFYEINPAVAEIACQHFTYLSESEARCDIVLGDARLSLEREVGQQFDLLLLDAFSSDAIPAHLLTCEAFATYLRHLVPSGIIAVHTSNRHLNLPPLVAKLGSHFGMHHGWILAREDNRNRCSASQWVLLSRDERTLLGETIAPNLRRVGQELSAAPLWTDQFNNLFQIMRL